MSEESVKRALSVIVKAELRHFCLVNCNIRVEEMEDEESKMAELQNFYYLCLGKHSLHILDRNMRAKEEFDGVLVTVPYACIENITFNPESRDSELFVLNFSSLPLKCKCPLQLFCNSTARKQLLDNLEICWRTDHMFQHWDVRDFPKTETKAALLPHHMSPYLPENWKGDQKGAASEFTNAPPGFSRHNVKDYMFFCQANFVPRIERASGRNEQGLFVSIPNEGRSKKASKNDTKLSNLKMHMETNCFFYIRVSEKISLEEASTVTCKQIAEHTLAVEIAPRLAEYRVIGTPGEYFKTQNLTGDPASWEAFTMHLRGLDAAPGPINRLYGNRDVAIVVARRKYIPPVMDMAQTFILVFYGESLRQREGSAFMSAPEGVIDTLSPRSRAYEPDRLVIQTKANALLFDEEAYAWYQARLNIVPKAVLRAKQFCKSILRLLDRVNLGDASTDTDVVFPEAQVDPKQDDPFEFASLLEKESDGLPDTAPSVLVNAWKKRVWRYIAYCVDGGLIPHLLQIDKLVYDQKTMTDGTRESDRIMHILETMLYLHGDGQPYRHIQLVSKVQDPKIMTNFVFNESVMVRLLETGYLKRVIGGRSDVSEYPRFLVRLLKRKPKDNGTEHPRLKYAVCKQLVTMSMEDLRTRLGEEKVFIAANDVSMNMLVPVLINLLYSQDENIKVLAVVSLVNYTNNHPTMKNVVMAGGGVRKVVTFLGSSNEDLVWHSCKLLAGCTKDSEQYRQTIASFGVVPRLIKLLVKNSVPPYYRPLPILIQACAVLGYLAHDAHIRNEITDHLSPPPPRPPKIISLLHELLKPDAQLDPLIEETKKESLYFYIINCLKNLAVRHKENKRAMKPILRHFRTILVGDGKSTKGTKDAPLISVILECLYVLSYDSAIRKICNEAYAPGNDTFGFGIMSVLKKYDGMGDIKDLVTFLRDLYDRTT